MKMTFDIRLQHPIKTLKEATDFIESLHAHDKLFHFEDNPSTIPCFSAEEAVHVKDRVAELYEIDWREVGQDCPIGYALEVLKTEEK